MQYQKKLLWIGMIITCAVWSVCGAPLAHYPMDGNFTDVSGHEFHLLPEASDPVFSSDPHVRPDGQSYGPLSAEPAEPTGAVSTELPSDISEGYTLSGFLRKPGTHDFNIFVFGFRGEQDNDPQLWLRIRHGRLQTKVGRGFRGETHPERVLTDGRWQHVALVIPPAGTDPDVYTVYLNGEALYTGPVDRFANYGTFHLAREPERDFAGFQLTEVQVYNRALSPQEVYALAELTGEPQPEVSVATGGGGPPLTLSPTVPLDEVGTQVAPGIYRSASTEVERIFVLAPDWILLVNNYMDETDALIYEAYEEAFDALLFHQETLEQGGNIDWVRHKQRTRLWQNAYVEFSKQHRWMAEPSNFTLRSQDDRAYRRPQSPAQSVVWVTSQNSRHIPDDHVLRNIATHEIGHYAYLRLSRPLQPGHTYTVTQRDGRAVTFTFNDHDVISPAIKANQIGYLPDAPRKYAYLGAWVPVHGPVDFSAFATFEVCRVEDGEAVYTGPIVLRHEDEHVWGMHGDESYSGEDIYEMDFSALTTPGKYYVRVPGLGRSYAFRIAPDALGPAFYTAARGFFHQRCGIALEAEHTAWTRGACHTGPMGTSLFVGDRPGSWELPDGRQASRVFRHLDFAIFEQTASEELDVNAWGGWHDAADYDKRDSHHIPVWDLLGLYEINPDAFTDGQLNLPESGNGIPDVLDEARFGIDHWKRAQQPDGGVTGRIETFAHPNHAGMPDQDTDVYYISKPDRNSTMHFAASAAYFAYLVEPFSAELAADYLERAERAYRWAEDPANSRDGFSITVNLSKAGQREAEPQELIFRDPDDRHYMAGAMAALNLYRITGKEGYRQDLNTRFGPNTARFFKAYPHWLRYYVTVYLMASEEWVDPEVRERARANLLELADEAIENSEHAPYRHAWRERRSRRWGSAVSPNFARYLVLAYKLTGEEQYRTMALLNIDFHLGCNALGMVQTTGIGQRAAPTIQNIETRSDGILESVPGLTPYGVIRTPPSMWDYVYTMRIGTVEDERDRRTVRFIPEEIDLSDLEKVVPLWRQIGPHDRFDPLCNEFTMQETIGPVAFTLGAFLGTGWMPDETLLNRQPAERPDFDSFYWIP